MFQPFLPGSSVSRGTLPPCKQALIRMLNWWKCKSQTIKFETFECNGVLKANKHHNRNHLLNKNTRTSKSVHKLFAILFQNVIFVSLSLRSIFTYTWILANLPLTVRLLGVYILGAKRPHDCAILRLLKRHGPLTLPVISFHHVVRRRSLNRACQEWVDFGWHLWLRAPIWV